MRDPVPFCHAGFCEICNAEVEFRSDQVWFRDFLACPQCHSVPRERALMRVLKTHAPNYAALKIHESSPCGRGISTHLASVCRDYSYSHYFPDVPFGRRHPTRKERCESLEALTFADASFDLIVTQDVMEHVLDPAAAFREINRVLRPGGMHVFTVPIVNKAQPSAPRARRSPDGAIEHLKEAQYHGNPIDAKGSLVTMDWGYDILRTIYNETGMASTLVMIEDIDHGIRAEYIDVIVSRKPGGKR